MTYPPYGPPPPPPHWYRSWMVPVRPLRARPRARASVLLPLIGLLLVVLSLFLLPWYQDPSQGQLSVPDVWSLAPEPRFGYVDGGFVAVLLPATLIAFAGTLDSTVFRVFFALGGCLIALIVFVLTLLAGLALTRLPDQSGVLPHTRGTVIGVGVVTGILIAALSIGYACTRGIGCRLISGFLLLVAAAIHLIAVQRAWPGAGNAEPGAYAAVAGYLLCALGAFIGPRYETPYRPY